MGSIEQRLEAVRAEMRAEGYDALVVPRADEYLGEYLPPRNERLRWLTGFTGSAGVAVVLAEQAAIFVDGRYTVQVRRQVPGELFSYCHLVEQPPEAWIAGQLAAGSRVALDPRMHSLSGYRRLADALRPAQVELVETFDNLVDRCWLDRPEPRIEPALLLEERFTGESSASKRQRLARDLAGRGADAALVFAPDSVSWLLNVRGSDVPNTPVLLGMGLLRSDGRFILLAEPGRIPPGFAEHVGEGVELLPESEAGAVLARFDGSTVLADPTGASAWSQLQLQRCGATLMEGDDPVLLPRACKNPVELEGARRAHRRDAVAEIRFLRWLDEEVAAGCLHDEATLADTLYEFRRGGEHFRGSSFDTISAAGANAALCHYNHRDAEPGSLAPDSVYLVDSGAQYLDGTTDITRTVAIGDPGPPLRRMFTLVLKGHIALDRARFPAGTTGSHLDVLARQFLWREGYDYDHGTGHGVGSFLSVHEAPQRISQVQTPVALRPGMIVSNEPGYYRENSFGIRCENLVAVRECDPATQEKPMLEFEVLTLVPFDRRLIDRDLLAAEEVAWLDAYHARVMEEIGPLLDGADRAWLERATRPL